MFMNDKKACFSAKTDEWSTPDDFYNVLNSIYQFTLDPCASDDSHKCEKYYTIETNGLLQSWENDVVWMNPPYSKSKEWIEKAYNEYLEGSTVICLTASRTDTKMFHSFCTKASALCFIKGRLKFGGSKHPAPFPSLLTVFDRNLNEDKIEALSSLGFCVML